MIKTPYIEKLGTRANFIEKKLLQHPRTKHFVRMLFQLKSVWQLKRANLKGVSYKDFFQAGKSVSGIAGIEPAGDIIARFAAAAAAEVKQAS